MLAGAGETALVPRVTVCVAGTGKLTVVCPVPPPVIVNGTLPPGEPAQVTLPLTVSAVLSEEHAAFAQAFTVSVSAVQVNALPSCSMRMWSTATETAAVTVSVAVAAAPVPALVVITGPVLLR